MKKTTLKTTKQPLKTKKTQKRRILQSSNVVSFSPTTSNDFIIATLIVSLLINLFLVSIWIALQYTTEYDADLSAFFFGR